jgi:hypothetical protein
MVYSVNRADLVRDVIEEWLSYIQQKAW